MVYYVLALGSLTKKPRLSVLMGKGNTVEWIGNSFRYCLLSGEQIQALPEEAKPHGMAFRSREKLIPHLCADLDKFRIV
jgi:hypothetical protein